MSTDPSRDTTSEIAGPFDASYERWQKKYGSVVVSAQAIREVIGADALRRILHHVYVEQGSNTRPGSDFVLGYHDYAQIHKAIRELYGQACHGILNRIGRITFRHFVEEQVNQMAAIGIALRLMPIRARKIFILRVVARSMSGDYHHDTVYLREDEGRLAVIDTNSIACHGITSDESICWHTVGFLEESLQWATGREFKVEETCCRAKGDPTCTFAIAREPSPPLNLA